MKKPIKIISYENFEKIKSFLRSKKTVLVGGCFDLIHYGHLQFLKKAKEQGDFLIIALESDEFIRKNKRKESIHSQDERAEILASLEMVDLVIKLPLFDKNEDYFQLVKTVSPKIIAVTEKDNQLINKKKQAKLITAKVKIVIPLLKRFSTRKIINQLE